MRKFTKLMLTLALLVVGVGGATSVKAETVKLYSTGFTEAVSGNCSYDEETKKFSWTSQYSNAVTVLKFTAGVLPYFSTVNLHVDDISEGGEFRIIINCGSVQKWVTVSQTGDISLDIADFQKWGTKITADEIATAFEIRLSGSDGEYHIGDWVKINPTSIYLETSWDAPMYIASTSDWEGFSKFVSSGVTNLAATLTTDVDAGSTMVGTDADGKRYTGSFDGAGHTLSFSYEGGGQFVAPFSCIYGATINDLLTTGTITTSNNMPGGIVGKNVGNSTLTRCGSSMTLSTTDASNGRIGGLVGRCADGNQMTFNNCLYNGSISTATSGGYACGFVGWDNQAEKITLNNCLVAASSITGGGQNFINNTPIIPDGKYAFYTTQFGSSTQGTKPTDAQLYNGYVAYTLNSDITEGTLFFGQDLKAVSSSPLLTDNVAYKVFDLGGGEYANWTNTISNNADWVTFSKLVANGTTSLNVTMTADVDAGSTMVGAENGKEYSGTFDGAGHTLTFNYEGSSDKVAPFKAVNGATIKDLITTGSISSSNNLLAGIIGQNNGATSLIRCASHMSVTTTVGDNGRIGGLVARNANKGSSLTFTNCMYDGAINSSTNQAAGFVGWSPNATTISNCLVASTSITGGESNFAPNLCSIPDGKYALYINKFGSSTQGTEATDAQLYNGYVAYTLNSDISDGVLFFGQGKLNSSVVELPSMTSVASKKVLKMNDDNGYANPGGLLPDPASKNKLSWKFENSGEAPYQTTLPAEQTTDKTIYGSPDAYNLVIGSAKASTFVFPYDVAKLPTGVKAYNLTFDGTDITASEVTSITADKPVLINAEPGTYRFNSGLDWWQSVDFSTHTSTTNGALTGVYNTSKPFSYVPEDAYVLQNGADGLGFYKVDAANTIKITSFRAYLTAETSARSLSIVFADETTGISEVSVVKDKNYFNLGGQRVSKPAKGLYIMNGKKVMIK